jgi:alpha-D-ribose 1-methylphosphonate 5-triphosphate diphosphatase PhnM
MKQSITSNDKITTDFQGVAFGSQNEGSDQDMISTKIMAYVTEALKKKSWVSRIEIFFHLDLDTKDVIPVLDKLVSAGTLRSDSVGVNSGIRNNVGTRYTTP